MIRSGLCSLGGPRSPCWWMVGYAVNPRGRLLFVGPSNPRFGICGKSKRVGLTLGPNDLGLDCGRAWETRRHEKSSRCRCRNVMESVFVWPSHQVKIMVNPIVTCLLCWPSDLGWNMVNTRICWWGWHCLASICPSWFFGLSPTFKLGIWHRDEWLKSDLAPPFYGWVEHSSTTRVWILDH